MIKNRNGRSANKSETTRHGVFVQKNAAWDRRVKNALSDLDKAAGKVKKSVNDRREESA
jgi:hypothetical protein